LASFTVVYDACVLYPAPLRDLLIRIAASGIVRARWSHAILDEMTRSILRDRSDLSREQLARTVGLMEQAVPDALVVQFESLIPAIDLPDDGDRHVVAAAVKCGAQAIVTFNLKHFPDHDLARWDLEPKHPDEFLLDSIDLAQGVVVRCLTEQAAALKNPKVSVDVLVETLRKNGLVRSASALQDLLRASMA
jgi:predicted nucleic acid-binding protein